MTNIWAGDTAKGLKTIEVLLDKVDGIVAVKDDMLGEFVRKMTAMASDKWAVFAGGQKQNHLAGRWRRKPYYSLNDEEMDGLKAFCQAAGGVAL